MGEKKVGFFRRGWAEFRDFAFKGNMIDLAIAVVIGGAFGGVVNSLVKDIVMPTISYVTTASTAAAHAATNVVQKSETAVAPPPATGGTDAPASPAPAPAAAPAPPPPAPAPAPAEDKGVEISFMLGRLNIGNFIAQLINFVLVAFAVFILMVKFVGAMVKRTSTPPAPSEPTTRECPYCLSVIPIKATRCAQCTSELPKA